MTESKTPFSNTRGVFWSVNRLLFAALCAAMVWEVSALAQDGHGYSYEELTTNVRKLCGRCHGGRRPKGNLVLRGFDVAAAHSTAETTEKMIVKLRAGMMPPPKSARGPDGLLEALVETLESKVDDAAAVGPRRGYRTFQRLNRAEYESSILDLLGLEVNAGDYLPLDTKSANFDNIADVQMLSASVLEAYLRAAAEISRLAVGDPAASPSSSTYTNPGYVSQWDRDAGAPRGTRGGISVVHTFPADGQYVFRMAFEHTTTGGFFGQTEKGEQIEISVDGRRAALLEVDRWMHVSDPNGVNMTTDPLFVRAGPHRVSAAFIRKSDGPMEDLLSPHDWSLTDRQIGVGGYGITALPHLKDLVITGPHSPTGVSETPSRRLIFTCRPTAPGETRSCAESIVSRLGSQAFRRPMTTEDLEGLLGFYDQTAEEGGFEVGIRTALQAILASPDFVFRLERRPAGVSENMSYRIDDWALASRLSFFLWAAPPDSQLRDLAARGVLSDASLLAEQVQRMIEDRRSEALGKRFASQWLRLEDLEKVHPDRLLYPDYHQQLADSMRIETERFFNSLVREDRSVLDLFSADYTFVDDRLARHYSIPGASRTGWSRVLYPDVRRRGLLGHGSILTLTSHANRTSPVLRGKWVMEVLLGTPPPPPPPGIPDLEETEATREGRALTTRERLALHRTQRSCNSCHQYIDPIGLALDNFDVTGKWRIRENGLPLDTKGEMYDGAKVQSPEDLRNALLSRPIPLIRNFTENLMAYALGRRIEYYDKPTIRAITREAAANGYRMSVFIQGIVASDAFQMQGEPSHAVSEGQ